jgi:hypothetical protein
VPLTAAGKLTIVASSDLGALGPREGIAASSDLGALGSTEGQPVIYNWVPPGLGPLVLPWLAILGLLALKSNRRAAAWWIWLPLGCVTALTVALLPVVPSDASCILDVIAALAAGLGAVWLLSDQLRRPHRFVTFLCLLLALAAFSALAFVPRLDWSFSTETIVAGILLAAAVLVSAAALSLVGLICRGRGRRVGLYGWLLILLVVIWLVIAAPFCVCALLTSGGSVGWSDFIAPVLGVVMVHFATLLPFLILSSASPFYRERLKALLHLEPETPPMVASLPDAILKT